MDRWADLYGAAPGGSSAPRLRPSPMAVEQFPSANICRNVSTCRHLGPWPRRPPEGGRASIPQGPRTSRANCVGPPWVAVTIDRQQQPPARPSVHGPGHGHVAEERLKRDLQRRPASQPPPTARSPCVPTAAYGTASRAGAASLAPATPGRAELEALVADLPRLGTLPPPARRTARGCCQPSSATSPCRPTARRARSASVCAGTRAPPERSPQEPALRRQSRTPAQPTGAPLS